MIRDILTELRPRSFSDFCGNKQLIVIMKKLVAEDRVPSGILIIGEPGSGKTTLASILARALSCWNWTPGQSEPCGNCQACGWGGVGSCGLNGYHLAPGIKPAEKYFSEALDDVKNKVTLWSESHRAVMTIDDLESLPVALQRTLRGRLDNPWPAGNIIATSAEPEKMDKPLRQRLCEYRIRPPDADDLVDWCSFILSSRLGLTIADDEAVDLLVKLGELNFRSILKIIHSLSASEKPIDAEVVRVAAMECGYGW